MSKCNHLWYTVEGDTVCRKCHANWPKPSAPTSKSRVGRPDNLIAPLPPKDAAAREFWLTGKPRIGTWLDAPPNSPELVGLKFHVIEYSAYERLELLIKQGKQFSDADNRRIFKLERELLDTKGDLACALTDLSDARAELKKAFLKETQLEACLAEREQRFHNLGLVVADKIDLITHLQDKLSSAEARCKELSQLLKDKGIR